MSRDRLGKVKLSIGRDRNGNKLVKLKSQYGGFSVQIDPRTFPELSRWGYDTRMMQADQLEETVLGQLDRYVRDFGTARQSEIMNKIYLYFDEPNFMLRRKALKRRNPKRKSKKSKQNRRRITFYRKFSGEDRYMGWRGNTQEGLWDAFYWLRQNDYQGNKANSIRIGKSVYRSHNALARAEGL